MHAQKLANPTEFYAVCVNKPLQKLNGPETIEFYWLEAV